MGGGNTLMIGVDTTTSPNRHMEISLDDRGRIKTADFEGVGQSSDTGLNDSDKTVTVPAATTWLIRSIYVNLATTATVGNRQVDVLLTDGSDNIVSKMVAGAVQAASVTREYVFAPSNPQETSFTNGLMFRAMPGDLILPTGYKIRMYDSAAVDAAADDMTIRILYQAK